MVKLKSHIIKKIDDMSPGSGFGRTYERDSNNIPFCDSICHIVHSQVEVDSIGK